MKRGSTRAEGKGAVAVAIVVGEIVSFVAAVPIVVASAIAINIAVLFRLWLWLRVVVFVVVSRMYKLASAPSQCCVCIIVCM